MATVYVDLPSEQVETVTVTAAEAIALSTTAKSLIAAPGANRTVQVVGVEVRMAGNIAFGGIAAGEDLVIRYTGETDVLATIETTGFLDQTDRPSRQAQAAYTAAIRPTGQHRSRARQLWGNHGRLRFAGDDTLS